jgi:hypothetical protein
MQIRIPLVPYTPSLFRGLEESERISAFYDPSERACRRASEYMRHWRELVESGVKTLDDDGPTLDLQTEALSVVKYLRQGATDEALPDGHNAQREFWQQFPFSWRHELAAAVSVSLVDESFLGKSSRQPA